MLCYSVLLASFMFSFVICLPKQEMGIAKKIVSQEVEDEDDKSGGKKKELVQLLENNVLRRVVDDDTGKILPGEVPGAVGVPHLPAKDKNFARRMSEARWSQQHARLHPKPFPEYKRVMHNRNSINDNRHDRSRMKMPRHPH